MALSRVKVWTNEILTSTDLNAEFNNVLNYLNSAQLQADLITSGTVTLNFSASGSPFNADQTCNVRWVKFGKEVTLHFSRLGATANGTPSTVASANATPLSALIPDGAASTFLSDSTQAFWAPVGAAISGSSIIYGAATVGIDSTGALQIVKNSSWATSNVNGWSAFSMSYLVP